MDLIYKPVTIYNRERDFIENFVMSSQFPWYYVSQQTYHDHLNDIPSHSQNFVNAPYLSHILLLRTEEEHVSHIDRNANDYSTYYEPFIEIFHRFMRENNLPYKKVFRANLNLNWYNGNGHTEPHYDHTWPHYNFIMYLNTCEQGQTLIWPKDFSVTHMVPCEQYHAVTFKGQWHAHRFPTLGNRRVVFVVTYI